MSLNMLRHNIEVLKDVSSNYSKLPDNDPKKLELKNQILFLTTSIQKLIDQLKNA